VGADDVRIGEFINKSQNLMENRCAVMEDDFIVFMNDVIKR
jgi:hypothetical protein